MHITHIITEFDSRSKADLYHFFKHIKLFAKINIPSIYEFPMMFLLENNAFYENVHCFHKQRFMYLEILTFRLFIIKENKFEAINTWKTLQSYI